MSTLIGGSQIKQGKRARSNRSGYKQGPIEVYQTSLDLPDQTGLFIITGDGEQRPGTQVFSSLLVLGNKQTGI